MISEPLRLVNKHIDSVRNLLSAAHYTTECALPSRDDCPGQYLCPVGRAVHPCIPSLYHCLELLNAERKKLMEVPSGSCEQ